MAIAVILGIIFLIIASVKDKYTVRIEWDSVAKFLSFMAVITCFRLGIHDLITEMGVGEGIIPQGEKIMANVSAYKFLIVFWEDAFFGLPIYYFTKKFKKKVWIPLVVILSGLFGLGHLYQGIQFAILSAIYPYFISYRYGRKHGFGTVMICHTLYDFITYITIIFAIELM